MKLSILPTAALAFAIAAPVLSQSSDGSYWNEYPKPANLTQIRGLGSLVMLETPSEYHFFSGQHRKWTVQSVTAPVLVGVANKQCVWRDGTTVYGYSTFSGKVVALPTSGAAIVSIGSPTSSWTAYVQDGNDVWAFSAFFGEWKPLSLPQPPLVGIGSHVVSAFLNGQVHAFSAFFGEWVTLPTIGAGAVYPWRNGVMATFSGPDAVAAFSAYTNTWNTIAYPTAGLTFDARDAYASFGSNGGLDRLWFSALRGLFTISSVPLGSSTTLGPCVAAIQSATGQTYGYAPGNGSVLLLPALPGAATTVAGGSFGACAMVDDGVNLYGFSGLRGSTTAAPLYVPFSLVVGDTEAFATGPAGEGVAYSAIRGDWAVAAPAFATATVANFECILRTLPNGHQAYSARTGTFADLLPAGGTVSMLGMGSIIGVRDATGIDVFDPRYGRWVRQQTGANPSFAVHRLVGIGQDGANAYGMSLWSYEWESIPLQGTLQGVTVNSSIGYVQTSSHVYVYTATGSMSTFARFPEFSRFHVLGQPLTHNQIGNPGAFCVALLSLTDVEASTPFGMLRVDPNPVMLPLGFVPADGKLFSPIPTPDVAALRGLTIFLQDVLLQPNGDIALSNGLAHYLW